MACRALLLVCALRPHFCAHRQVWTRACDVIDGPAVYTLTVKPASVLRLAG